MGIKTTSTVELPAAGVLAVQAAVMAMCLELGLLTQQGPGELGACRLQFIRATSGKEAVVDLLRALDLIRDDTKTEGNGDEVVEPPNQPGAGPVLSP